MKIITAAQAGALIPDNATIFLGGLAVSSLPEEVLKGVEKNFLDTGHPRNAWDPSRITGNLLKRTLEFHHNISPLLQSLVMNPLFIT